MFPSKSCLSVSLVPAIMLYWTSPFSHKSCSWVHSSMKAESMNLPFYPMQQTWHSWSLNHCMRFSTPCPDRHKPEEPPNCQLKTDFSKIYTNIQILWLAFWTSISKVLLYGGSFQNLLFGAPLELAQPQNLLFFALWYQSWNWHLWHFQFHLCHNRALLVILATGIAGIIDNMNNIIR